MFKRKSIFVLFLLSTFVIFGIHVIGCDQLRSKQKTENKVILSQNTDTLFLRNDTIVTSILINNGSACILSWGVDGIFINVSKDTLPMPHPRFNELYKDGDYFLVKDGCGTACYYAYLIPFKKQKTGKLYLYPLLFSANNKLIVFQDGTSESLVSIENIETGKRYNINELFDLTVHPYSDAIDTVFVDDSLLFISWQTSKSKKKTTSIRFKEILY